MKSKTVLALCLEFPLGMRAGVSVLVSELVSRLADKYSLVLVSADEDLREHPSYGLLRQHIAWNPRCEPPNPTFRSAAHQLGDQLVAAGVEIAHFHAGGTFGWGNRLPGFSPIGRLHRAGVRCFWTSHLAVSFADGFAGQSKALWQKLLLYPLSYLAKWSQTRTCEAEICVSAENQRKLRRWYPTLAARFRLIYHSRLDDSQVPAPDLKRLPQVLNLGHVAFRKGQHILAEAFCQLAADFPQWDLLLAGHDSGDGCWQRIAQIAAQHHLTSRIHLLGDRPDSSTLQRQAGIYVQPSFFEGLPLALQEAMFYGCPAVATNVSGNPELVVNEVNGLLISAGLVTELAAALRRLLGDPFLRQTWGGAARRHVLQAHMTAKHMATAYEALYERSR